jgi:hypothetical protein
MLVQLLTNTLNHATHIRTSSLVSLRAGTAHDGGSKTGARGDCLSTDAAWSMLMEFVVAVAKT